MFGLEGQGNWADLKGSNFSALFPGTNLFTNESKINAFGLFTGQIGWAANNVLFYVKGGAAVTNDHFRVTFTPTGTQVTNNFDDTRWGGTVGAGLEYGFAPNWTAGIEYDHLFMQDRTVTLTTVAALGGGVFSNERIRQDVDLVTVRVNYRWGGPAIPKYSETAGLAPVFLFSSGDGSFRHSCDGGLRNTNSRAVGVSSSRTPIASARTSTSVWSASTIVGAVLSSCGTEFARFDPREKAGAPRAGLFV